MTTMQVVRQFEGEGLQGRGRSPRPCGASAFLPVPRCPISIRVATSNDLPFIDALQKHHSKMLGFMPFAQLKGYVESGNVLIAEEAELRNAGGTPTPLGYIIAKDRYFKRDDVGVIFQLNVEPGAHRKLVGASLVKAVFERAAYGCKLFCCWCAQDIEANYFWESIGFVPLAFRSGSRGRKRIHIFWQRRINQAEGLPGETPGVPNLMPYWFPSQTGAGAIREDRLVLPIPPGTHWKDAKPVVLPGHVAERKLLAAERKRGKQAPTRAMSQRAAQGLRFPDPAEERAAQAIRKPKEPKPKADPRHVAMARELRDRYLEEVNSGLLLPAPPDVAKYDVSRRIEAVRPTLTPALSRGEREKENTPLLEAA